MKRLFLIATSTIAIALTSTLPAFAGGRPVVTDPTGPNVTDPTGPNVTDPTGPNVTDPSGGNVTDRPGGSKYPKRHVRNRDRVKDGHRVAKQLKAAYTKCQSTGDCAEFNRLYAEGLKHRDELRREKPVRDTSNRLW
ncbi:MAG: hypothetical protein MUC48_02350 [Leptolyngbya sp. Prado105]|nr:hypothetical protein [Leptolyngbya sp. Prado105]